jgi:hypothetical protein
MADPITQLCARGLAVRSASYRQLSRAGTTAPAGAA